MIFHENPAGTFTQVLVDLSVGDEVIPFGNFALWDDATLAAYGCYRLELPSAPTGQILQSWSVQRVTGVVQTVPVYAPKALSDQQGAKAGAVDSLRDAKLANGYTVPQSVSAALAGKVLQTRDADDRTNWLTSQASYSAAVTAGQGATIGAEFRAADNSRVTISYSEGLNVLLAMAAWGKSVYGRSWDLKDAIAAAADQAALDAIDITTGWPA